MLKQEANASQEEIEVRNGETGSGYVTEATNLAGHLKISKLKK